MIPETTPKDISAMEKINQKIKELTRQRNNKLSCLYAPVSRECMVFRHKQYLTIQSNCSTCRSYVDQVNALLEERENIEKDRLRRGYLSTNEKVITSELSRHKYIFASNHIVPVKFHPKDVKALTYPIDMQILIRIFTMFDKETALNAGLVCKFFYRAYKGALDLYFKNFSVMTNKIPFIITINKSLSIISIHDEKTTKTIWNAPNRYDISTFYISPLLIQEDLVYKSLKSWDSTIKSKCTKVALSYCHVVQYLICHPTLAHSLQGIGLIYQSLLVIIEKKDLRKYVFNKVKLVINMCKKDKVNVTTIPYLEEVIVYFWTIQHKFSMEEHRQFWTNIFTIIIRRLFKKVFLKNEKVWNLIKNEDVELINVLRNFDEIKSNIKYLMTYIYLTYKYSRSLEYYEKRNSCVLNKTPMSILIKHIENYSDDWDLMFTLARYKKKLSPEKKMELLISAHKDYLRLKYGLRIDPITIFKV